MVNRKAPKTLKAACISAIPAMIHKHVRKMAHKASALEWYGFFQGNTDVDTHQVLRDYAKVLHEFIFSYVIWYDYEEIFKALMVGVEGAIQETRKSWRPKCDIGQYRKEMEAMAKFSGSE